MQRRERNKPDLSRMLESTIELTRWLLVPFYLGTSAALLIYVVKFLRSLLELLHSLSQEGTATLLAVLHLLENVMVANLVLMVMVGGFSSLAATMGDDYHMKKLLPLDSTKLKVKFGLALISVSSIYLLEAFVNNEPSNILVGHVVIHLTFVVSTVAMTWIDSTLNRPAPAEKS